MRRARTWIGATLAAFGIAWACLGVPPAHAEDAPRRVWVLDAQGRPLPGAELVALVAPATGTIPLYAASAEALASADAKGWIVVPANAPRWLGVRAREASPARVPATGDTITLRLLPRRPLTGRVRFATPPEKRVALEVLALPTGAGDLGHRTVAAEDGSYAFPALHDGVWRLAVRRAARLVSLGRVRAGAAAGDHTLDLARQFAGAVFRADASDSPVPDLALELRSLTEPAAHPVTATTDDKGRFAFAAVPQGTYEAYLGDPAFAFDGVRPRVVAGPTDAPAEPTWFVTRCPALTGQVLTPDKQPIPDAAVRILPPAHDQRRGPVDVKTDAEGRFRFAHVPPGDGYRLLITGAGFSPWVGLPFRVAAGQDTALDPVRMDPGWLLEVVVKDLAGHPLPDAHVRAVPATRPNIGKDSPWTSLAQEATTDADGMARMRDMPIDDTFVEVRAPNRRAFRVHVPYPRAADRGRVDVVLEPAPSLSGTVVGQSADKGPYVVHVRSRDGGERHEVETDGTTGAFTVTALRTVAYDIDVRAPDGLLLARVEHILPALEPEIEITLSERQTLTGRVFGLEEAPEAVAQLESPKYDRTLARYVWVPERTVAVERSGAEGAIQVTGVRPGVYALRVLQGGRATPPVHLLVEDAPLEGIELRMADGARLAGLVFGADSRPRAGVRITAAPLRGDGAARAPEAGVHTAFTDDDGAFVFEALAPGLWHMSTHVLGHASREQTVRLAPGESVVLNDIELADGVHLRGTVQDTEGRVLDGVRIVVRRIDGSGPSRTALTDLEGGYDVPHLAAGTYLVRVEGIDPQFLPSDEAAVEIEDEDVVLDFLPGKGAALTAMVARAGKAVSGAAVELIAVPDQVDTEVIARRRRGVSDGEGKVTFETLEPGTYFVALEVGALRSEQRLTLEAHDRIEVELEAHEGRLRGRVFGPGGRPVPAAFVEAQSQDDPEVVAQTRANGEGHFVMPGIPIGAYDVVVRAPGLPPARLEAKAELSGSDFPYDVHLGHGGDILLTVVDMNDRPIVGAQVFAETPEGRALHQWPFATGPDGEARLRGMPEGLVHVRVRARGYGSPAPQVLRVDEGTTTEHRVVMGPGGSLRVVVRGTQFDPVPRVQVEVLHAASGLVGERRRPLRRLAPSEAGELMPRAGSVRFRDLQPGPYRVRIDAGARYVSFEQAVDVHLGAQAFVDVQLTLK